MKKISFIFVIALLGSTLLAGQTSNRRSKINFNEANINTFQDDPDYVWRYVPKFGWRKFSPEGDAYKEWKDWKSVRRPHQHHWFKHW
ncbi:MAG: hypothetical protein KC505_01965 [Myxococcales bacterium]|nr:hypothetical protein [Myxococcales bacterium]USN51228.1 MAG: hypothetical protein H6731_02130 [Myxococcales bacterium]